ncbi:conserved putative membrane protein [Candidatus Protochlamydia naegleriophila]|uniref:Conserved putative membrane protein n=1 Tax=Candidatus Protochlamydia naegleriophila TaxID=389348 RepID=A0A0U5K6T8_9BACT|nr:DUF202 domain-containing protein [Candidatus Protochlamydia naegleriophila]CUI17883.1 conserved putative membrane protein [Candidatus Protochlamydia naegleriophila]
MNDSDSFPPSLENERNLLAQERTRLASERTFLSWIRTGLTGIGIGIAIARLVTFQTYSHQKMAHWIGQFLILWGIGIFLFALISYRRSVKKIEMTSFTAYHATFWGLSFITIALIIFTFVLLWIVVE